MVFKTATVVKQNKKNIKVNVILNLKLHHKSSLVAGSPVMFYSGDELTRLKQKTPLLA